MTDSIDVLAQLRAAILQGDYSPLQRLVEADLAEAYDSSRFVVRQALLQLQSEGLVEIRKNRGARVHKASVDDSIGVTEVIGAIEEFVAARAAERITPAQIAALRSLGHELTVAVKSIELQRYADISDRLHQQLREIADHPQATRVLEQLSGQTVRHQLMLLSAPGRPMASLREQLAVIDAVCSKNPADAEAAMRQHFAGMIAVFETQRPAPEADVRAPDVKRHLFSGIDNTPDVTLAYADQSPNQQLDLYLPKPAAGPIPLIIALHGGAFAMGDRTWDLRHLPQALERGYAVASLDYRLSDEAVFPAAVLDVKSATAFLRAQAPQYNLDPSFFVAWGRSAGGNLAAMLGATSGRRTEFDQSDVDSSVAAVIDWYGPSDLLQMDAQFLAVPPSGQNAPPQNHDGANSPESRYLGAAIQTVPKIAARANPITWVKDAKAPLPPFFLAAGTNDRLVPFQQTVLLADALRRHGGAPEVHILADANHADERFELELTGPAFSWLTTLRNNI